MPLIKSILFFYIFYGVLLIAAPLNISLLDVLPGYLLSCFILVVIFTGFFSSFRTPKTQQVLSQSFFNANFFSSSSISLIKISGFISIPLSIYAANFYTGLMPIDVFVKVFIETVSSYNEYQKFFNENELGTFSLSKVPAILANFYVKITMMYLLYLAYFDKANFKGFVFNISLLFSILAFLYFSFARGTSFELFEIIAYNFFVIFIGSKERILKTLFSKRFVIYMFFVFLSLILYSINISMRYSGDYSPTCHSAVFCYEESYFLPLFIDALLFKLSGYFSFGFYYLTQFVDSTMLDFDIISHSILSSSGYGFELRPRFLCSTSFDCQALWSPSLETWIINYGLLHSLLIIFIMSVMAGLIFKRLIHRRSFPLFVLCYIFFLQVISFPVGHFVDSSSANKLAVIFSLSIVIVKFFIRKVSAHEPASYK